MPQNYGYEVSDEAQRRAMRDAWFQGGLSLIGSYDDLGTAIGGAVRAGAGAHRESIGRSYDMESAQAQEQEADQEELEELNRRLEAVKSLPPEMQEEMQHYVHTEKFWDVMAKQGFKEETDDRAKLPSGYRYGESGDAERIPGIEVEGPSDYTLGDARYSGETNKMVAQNAKPAGEKGESLYVSPVAGEKDGKQGNWYRGKDPSTPSVFVPYEGMDDTDDSVDFFDAVEGKVNPEYDDAFSQWKEENRGRAPDQRSPMPDRAAIWAGWESKLKGEVAPEDTQVPLGPGGQAEGPITVPNERPGRPGEVPGSPAPAPIDMPAEAAPLPVPPGATPENFIEAGMQSGDTPAGIIEAAGQYGPEFAAAVQAALGG